MQKHTRPNKAAGRAAVAIALFMFLGACSSVPDWANPVEWYRGTAEWVGGEDEGSEARAKARQADQGSAAGNQEFPNLASVPERPKRVTTQPGRQRVQSALVADRARARHEALAPGPMAAPAGPGAPPAPMVAARPAPAAAAPPAPNVAAPAPAPSMPAPSAGNQAFRDAIAQQERAPAGVALRGSGPSGVVMGSPVARGGSHAYTTGTKIGTLYFANGSSQIRKKYGKTLRDIVKMQKQKGGKLKVIGHASSRTSNTDPLRHQITNFRISMARARAVAQRLVRYGASSNSIEVVGLADQQRVYQEIMPTGEAGNRRVEIFLEN